MSWFQEHWSDILAVIGAAYSIALIVVKLTPTPKDDAAMAKVNVFLRALAKVFGLDLRQGINTKSPKRGPVKGRTSGKVDIYPELICLAVVFSFVGCAVFRGISSDPAKQYQASALTFSAAVDSATVMLEGGQLEPEEVVKVSAAIEVGHAILKEWSQALKDGKDYPGGGAAVASVVTKIKAVIEKGGG